MDENYHSDYVLKKAKSALLKFEHSTKVIAPYHIKNMFDKEYFTINEASLFLYHNLDKNNQYHFDDNPNTYSIDFIMDGISQGDIEINQYETIPKKSLQEFLYKRDYRISEFSDNLLTQEPIGCGNPTIQQTEPNIENLNVEIEQLKREMASKDQTIVELQQKNSSLEAEKMQRLENENAMVYDEISLKDSGLLLISVLLKMLQNEIKVARNKTQAKILQKIEDEHKDFRVLSKSTTEKIMKDANGLYKQLKNKRMQ